MRTSCSEIHLVQVAARSATDVRHPAIGNVGLIIAIRSYVQRTPCAARVSCIRSRKGNEVTARQSVERHYCERAIHAVGREQSRAVHSKRQSRELHAGSLRGRGEGAQKLI